MAQTGYTPIQLYYSSTSTNVPLAANLAYGELAINITDGKLFYKDNSGSVQVIAWKTTPTIAGGTGLTSYTAGDLLYYATGTTLTKLGIGANTTVLTSSGTGPQWTAQSVLSVGTSANLKSNATTGVMQITGPAAASTRVMTTPDANFTAARTDAAQSFIGDQTLSTGNLVIGTSGKGVTTGSAIPLGFGTNNGTSDVTLDTSGRLLVGTTSNTTVDRLAVISATGTTDTALIENDNSSTFASNVLVLGATRTTTNSTFNFLTCITQGVAYRLYIRDSGNVVNQNNSYGAISDVKLKENITDATPKLEKLNQVRVVNYNLKGETQKQLGVVAQELEQIFPGMVEETRDRDVEGNDLGTNSKSVKYSVFVPMLIKAIQEQQTLIQSLQSRIETLENK